MTDLDLTFHSLTDPHRREILALLREAGELRVGGSFLIVMRVGDKGLEHRGVYQEITKYDASSSPGCRA